jgi:acyl-CoA thioester hydrolase
MQGQARANAAHHQWPVRVYWEDTDAGGIVFYANYLKFFERARTEWLRALGLQQAHIKETLGGMFVVSETQVRYHLPSRLDDALLVTTTLSQCGKASLVLAQSAWLDDALLCEATIRIGWVSSSTIKPARLPLALSQTLQSVLLDSK